MSACAHCAAPLLAGALLCPACGQPVVAPVAPVAIAGSAAKSDRAHALALVRDGVPDDDACFAFPRGDFRWLLGRHDLTARPPVVVDLDLSRVAPAVELADGTRGFAVSRRHASLARVAGILTLTATIAGNTFVKRAGEPEFVALDAGESKVIDVGSRVVFGTREPLTLEVT